MQGNLCIWKSEIEETENKRSEWSENFWEELIAHALPHMLHCAFWTAKKRLEYQELYFGILSTSWLWYLLLIWSRRTSKEGLPGCSPPASQIRIETTQILFIRHFTWSTLQLQSATDICWWLVHHNLESKIENLGYLRWN